MRQDIIDELTGERIPFRDFKDYRKLSFLVPEAQCNTRAGVITKWMDERPQPTYDEIEAVLDADVEKAEQEWQEDHVQFEDHIKKLARGMFVLHNKVRVIEGKQKVSWRVFIRQMKNL